MNSNNGQKDPAFWNETPNLGFELHNKQLTNLSVVRNMLTRHLCTLSKSTVRAASIVSQIPAMQFSTDMKVGSTEHKVYILVLTCNSLAFLQTLRCFPFQS